jgi:16S rRNA processing protein RimM
MRPETSRWIVLAHLIRPQGRKGELLAELFTDFPDRLVGREGLLLARPGFDADAEQSRIARVTSSWLPVGKNKGRIVLKLEGVNTISEAEALMGFDLITADDLRLPLDGESVYISDLIGCILYDGAIEVGTIEDIQFPSSLDGARIPDAAALLEIKSEAGEVLIPFVKDFLQTMDLPGKRIVMNLPPGLVTVNLPD